ncbi:Ras GTPase-activating protein-binding protein 2 [Habropoda laboriosa]|uniref:Ras GTPase-activating protein-binding protein 2 n=1 Tax=Habropoda laboriosa TaxID=597456 RepID=A0A0L7RJQ1_9HYME|nr:Ras GTPase-activating protein-binding protein 2 [Habropoda laboriosa]
MVMEASPSPQNVGREFVRQYYTLLNQAPAHLHRFYNQHSSFVHGGLDSNRESTPAIGQKQIHQKIQQLNFRDCHAKISQVDSQLTLENGVVVQVSGELSNAGQPMRRFTQTFVLAIQAPKTYYVHNDIFRYQDLIFPDEEEADVGGIEGGVGESGEREGEEGIRSEPEEDEHQNRGQQLTTPATSTELQTQPPLIPTQQPVLQQQQQQMYYAPPPQQSHVHPVMQQVLNGSVHEEAPLINQQPPQQQQQQQQQTPPPPAQQHQYITEPTTQTQFVQETELDTTTAEQQQQTENEPQTQSSENREQPEAESFTASVQESEPEHQVTNTSVTSSGPKTYANLVKSFPSTTGATSPQAPKLSISPPPMTNLRLDDRSPLHPISSGPAVSTSTNVSTPQQQTHRVGNQQPQQQHQQQRAPRGGAVQRDGDRRGTRQSQYSDAHQLFLGNLPHNASEDDLRQVFESYGRVVELRIHSKSNDRCKGPQGNNTGKVPNYGFITFEDQQVVSKVLQNVVMYKMLNNCIAGKFLYFVGGPGGVMRGGQHGTRGGRGGFSRGGDGGRGGGGMRQSGLSRMPHDVIKGAIRLRLNIACIVCQATTIGYAAEIVWNTNSCRTSRLSHLS